MIYTATRLVAAAMLLVALGDLPYGYYTLLRFVVCCVATYGAFRAYEAGAEAWVGMLGGTALLFNPVLSVYLARETWAVVDALTAALLVGSIIGQPKKATHVSGIRTTVMRCVRLLRPIAMLLLWRVRCKL